MVPYADLQQLEAQVKHLREHSDSSPELVDAINQLARARAERYAADLETQQLLEESYRLATRITYVAGQAHSLIAQSWQCIQQGEPERGMPAASQAVELAEQHGDKHLEAIARYATSLVQEEIGNDAYALENRLKALALVQEIGDEPRAADYQMAIGLQYLQSGQYEQATQHFTESGRIYRQCQDNKLCLALNNLAWAYTNQGKLAEALQIAEEAFAACDVTWVWWRSMISHTLGEIYLRMGSDFFDQAQQHLTQALALETSNNYSSAPLRADIEMSQARLLTKQGRLMDAIQSLQTLAAEALSHQRRPILTEVMGQIYSTYKQAGMLAEALEYHEQYYQLRAELGREKTERQVRTLYIMHETREAHRASEIFRLKTVVLEQMVQERAQALERTQMEMLERLAMAVETRDTITGDHVTRVGDLSARIAAKLGLPGEIVESIRLAARLHDIGKIGIPDSILLKRTGLSAHEYQIMKSHTIKGALILANSSTPLFRMAEEIALAHHERWDGKGYPHHLAGNDIPITGRIVAVADAFDAMIGLRPYKPTMPMPQAVAEVLRCSGTQFDPTIVQAFFELIEPECQVEVKPPPAIPETNTAPRYWSVPLTTIDKPVYTASVSVSIS